MQSRSIVRLAALLTVATLSLEAVAADMKPQTSASSHESSGFLGFSSSPRTLLAARQALRDRVCYALADGQISPSERTSILIHAQSALTPEEYATFKRKVDQLAPPLPAAEKQQLARHHVRWQRSVFMARTASPKMAAAKKTMATSKIASSKKTATTASKVASSQKTSAETLKIASSLKTSTAATQAVSETKIAVVDEGPQILVSDHMASKNAAR